MILQPPAPALQPFVEHYWLSLHNVAQVHPVIPDGRVDIVLEVTEAAWQGWAYGSTTKPTGLGCTPGCHYLGVRFRPGQSRHFLRASAHELTDRREDLRHLLRVPAEALAAQVSRGDALAEIDRRLAALLHDAPPEEHQADQMVRDIEAAHGVLRLGELAARLGRSPRRLQRLFLETVGVTPKFFSLITRARRAAQLMAAPGRTPLADVAAQAGYADQSHMTRDFVRLAGVSPARWQAAFLQDAGGTGAEY
jgi:AraC-like DNA-binding protein